MQVEMPKSFEACHYLVDRLHHRIEELKKTPDAPVYTVSMQSVLTGLRGAKVATAYLSDLTMMADDSNVLHIHGEPMDRLTNMTAEEMFLYLHFGRPPSQNEKNELAAAVEKLEQYFIKTYWRNLGTYLRSVIHNSGDARHAMTPMMGLLAATESELVNKRTQKGSALTPKELVNLHFIDGVKIFAWQKIIFANLARCRTGLALRKPKSGLSFSESIVDMLAQKIDSKKGKTMVQFFDMYFTMHCEHGRANASQQTGYTVGACESSSFAAVIAGQMALAGGRHGGANSDALKFLEKLASEIGGHSDTLMRSNIRDYLTEAFSNGKIPGIGHAEYVKADCRNVIMRELCESNETLKASELVQVACIANDLTPEISQEIKGRRLYPNVDFLSGVILDSLGFKDAEMFTTLFQLMRSAGISAQNVVFQADEMALFRPSTLTIEELEAIQASA